MSLLQLSFFLIFAGEALAGVAYAQVGKPWMAMTMGLYALAVLGLYMGGDK